MSEERDIKPDINDERAGPSQYDPATPVKPKGAKLMLIVSSPDGQHIKIGIKPTSTFAKMFEAASVRSSLIIHSRFAKQNYRRAMIRFLYDGQRVRAEQTPEQVRSSGMA
ncbi:4627_t:CDS:2 [Acaulospora colombiana]|uniref:4627_t:CDS:1 n=1 Tax=Acaulospora colombiana TaxID=27376 RepID=A0ACA9PEV5_9GLOM|nr:4627_t:CDS:2 [Acaulospora colombiana]